MSVLRRWRFDPFRRELVFVGVVSRPSAPAGAVEAEARQLDLDDDALWSLVTDDDKPDARDGE